MCGIVGIAGFEDRQLLRQMNSLLSHRGPDDSGEFFDSDVCLGQRRLSIIDLSEKGHQPMSNEDGNVWITYNGEVYNFMDLREELEKKGHKFRSDTDTETIIHAYEEYGERCLERLNGMFAFAIYDRRHGKKIFMARDRTGVKPLHYCFVDRNLLFASEIKALLMHEKVAREINLNSLHKFMNFNYIFGGDTMFRGISKLEPGHYMVYDVKKKIHVIVRYWDLAVRKTDFPEDYYINKIREGLSDSIRQRLVSDVPLGVFLSGGIDSSSILALMSGFKDIEKPIKTYSVGFNEPWDELKDARRISEEFGTDHHEMFVESDVLERTPEFIWHMDAPKTNLSPQFYISKLAKKSVTVALTGLGGDELFAGYRRHKYYYHQKSISAMVPEAIAKPLFNALGKVAVSNYLKRGMIYLANIHDKEKTYAIAVPLLIYDDERDDIYGEKLKNAKTKMQDFKAMLKPYFSEKGVDYYNQCMKMEIRTYLNDDLLERMDRMAMAHAVEARVPFLDYKFIEFAFSIPNKYRRFSLGSRSGKYLLCKAMKGRVPDFVFSKKKVGFNMSPYYWFKANLRQHMKAILTKDAVDKRGLFRYGYVQKVLDRKPTPNLYYQYQALWNMMVMEIWQQMYIDSDIDEIRKPRMKIGGYS